MSFPRFLITALFFLVMSGIVVAAPSDTTALEAEIKTLTREADAFIEKEADAYLDRLARSCLPEGISPEKREAYDKAIAVYDAIEHRHGQDARETIRLHVLSALGNKARALLRLRELEAEEAIWEDIWRRFGQEQNPRIRARLAQALSWRVCLLFCYGNTTAITTAADRMLAHFDRDEAPAVRRALAAALYYKGSAIIQRYGKATASYAVDTHFGQDRDPETRYWVVRALRETATYDEDERAALYREIDRRFGGSEELPKTRALVIQGLLDHLHYDGTWKDTDDIYAEIERRFGEDADTLLREQVLRALVQKAEAQTQDEAALAVCDEIMNCYQAEESEAIGALLAKTRKKRFALRTGCALWPGKPLRE
jgi:hypothetical protein